MAFGLPIVRRRGAVIIRSAYGGVKKEELSSPANRRSNGRTLEDSSAVSLRWNIPIIQPNYSTLLIFTHEEKRVYIKNFM